MKLKAKINGAEQEIDSSDLMLPEGAHLLEAGQTPEGYVSREFMQSEIQRRGKNLVRREELLKDDEFFREAAQQRKIQIGEDGRPVASKGDVDPQKLFSQWEEQHLKPANEKAQKLEGAVQKLREQTLVGQIMQAAAQAGLKKSYLTAPADGMDAPVVSMFRSAFGFDEETGSWAVREGEGFRYGPDPSRQRYAGPGDFFGGLQKNDAFRDWFEDRRASATGFQQHGSGATGDKVMQRSQFDTLDAGARHSFVSGGGKVVD